MSHNIKKSMREEFAGEIAKGYVTLDEIRENSHEWVDGYLPIYNNEIIDAWRDMPYEYDNRGHTLLGQGGDVDIVNLMSLDLYLYYNDLLNEVITEMEGAGE